MMNSRNGQIHVSIVNKYVDFYEEHNRDSMERNGSNIKKNGDGKIYENKIDKYMKKKKKKKKKDKGLNKMNYLNEKKIKKDKKKNDIINSIEKENNDGMNSSTSWSTNNSGCLIKNDLNTNDYNKIPSIKLKKNKIKSSKDSKKKLKKSKQILLNNNDNIIGCSDKEKGEKVCKSKFKDGTQLFLYLIKKYPKILLSRRSLSYYYKLVSRYNKRVLDTKKYKNEKIKLRNLLYKINLMKTTKREISTEETEDPTTKIILDKLISRNKLISTSRGKQKIKKKKNEKENNIYDNYISNVDGKEMKTDSSSDEYIEDKLRKYKNDKKKIKKTIKKVEKKYIMNIKRSKNGEANLPVKYNKDEDSSEEIKKKKEVVPIQTDDDSRIEKRDDGLDSIFNPCQDIFNYKTFENRDNNVYNENDEEDARDQYIARLEEKQMIKKNKKSIKTKKKSHNTDSESKKNKKMHKNRDEHILKKKKKKKKKREHIVENESEELEKEDSLISSQNESDDINTKEYLILKEIKMKQDSQKIRLNLDASCFASKGAGLYNYGQNICFFNSIIQTIVRIPYICKDLLNKLHSLNCEKKKKKEFCFYCIFEHFGYNIISKKNVIKNSLIPYIKKYICNSYNIGYQEDVHEYLRYFLCSLEKSSFFSSVYIQKMFTGVTKNVTMCMNCNNVSLKYEQYYELSLDISSVNNLEEALKNFLSNEMLIGDNGYYCEKCRKKKKATKQCVINKLPRVLTIQIKRFFMNSKFNIVKNRKHISYPLCLDMKYYVNNYYLFKNSINDDVIHLYEKMMSDNQANKNNDQHQTDQQFYNETKSNIGHPPSNNPNKLKQENYNNVKKEMSPNDFSTFEKNENNSDNSSEEYKKYDNKDLNVLREIENIFIQLKNEIYMKLQNRHPPISSLKNLVIEKKKEIKKELNKIKYFKFYKGAILKISKDINTLYYCVKNSAEKNKKINLKTLVFKYRVDYYERKHKERENSQDEINFLNKKNEKDNFFENNRNSKNENKGEANLNNNKLYQNNNHFYYELTGLIKHIGSGTDYGHYIALTKSNNNIYLQCDDNNISYVNKKDILNCAKNAYVFVYTCSHPQFIDFYNAYVDVLEKKKFDINLPVFEKRVEFRERITMPKKKFISRSLCYAIRG
ncbi:ubiquitin carboxyl-terminal hydrolase, putative [Plasmodium vinckei vinckei]|uniref:ubiquitinyl hydrolase 1 n=1 Tax=Plasmodium vinckei vinckei TaxID=54757 RepID=A0A449BU32_PLAVN|nr:ubiquitin carboxyl-terminal hydrolase, putative [Plasmodium vinckei vinckei]VEV56986.1 ubiquitin carboxyl-terminal hydrolase, putative [Plasmodium vinckei vinckei]